MCYQNTQENEKLAIFYLAFLTLLLTLVDKKKMTKQYLVIKSPIQL